jgi:hypothetical protein
VSESEFRDKNPFIQPMNWTATLDEFTLAKVSENLPRIAEWLLRRNPTSDTFLGNRRSCPV